MPNPVRDIYLKVIEQTIESARAEFTEGGVPEDTVRHLDTLKTRWRERLLQTQDFSEDPQTLRNAAGYAAGRATRSVRGGQVMAVTADNVKEEPRVAGRGSKRKAEESGPASKKARIGGGDAVAVAGAGGTAVPGAINPKTDDEKYKDNSDLGSSSDDSDIDSVGSDPEVDNFILAQHDRVRKGNGKWKVQLKEGIAHINGRDYLFNRATCDLDW